MNPFNKINKSVVPFLIMFLLTSICHAQEGYSIHGKLDGLIEGEKLIMRVFEDKGFRNEIRDSGFVKNGEFDIQGYVLNGPRVYWLEFKKTQKYLVLFINNKDSVTIRSSYNIGKIDHGLINHYVIIEGSPSNYANACLTAAVQDYQQNVNIFDNSLGKIKDSIGFDTSLVQLLLKDKRALDLIFYLLHLRNPEPDLMIAIPRAIFEMYETGGRPSFLMDVFNKLDEDTKNSHFGKKMKQFALLSNGQPFPEFTLSTPNGNMLSLKDITSKSKITVIEFWASNSINKDKNQQELMRLYKKYHSKGLNIIGVSSDTNEEKWKRSIAGLPWYQVSDLKGSDGVVGKVYMEYGRLGTSIPNTTNVVLDENGKILAWDANEYELLLLLWKILEQ